MKTSPPLFLLSLLWIMPLMLFRVIEAPAPTEAGRASPVAVEKAMADSLDEPDDKIGLR